MDTSKASGEEGKTNTEVVEINKIKGVNTNNRNN
jgi:hypothetical protein